MSNATRGLVLFLLLFLPACANQTEAGPTASSTSTIEPQETQAAPTTPAATLPVSAPTLENADPPPEIYTGSLAGLIYYDQQGIWKIAEDETPVLLFDFQGEEIRSVSISPNLDKILYRNSQSQIFLGDVVADIHTGETVESYYGDYALCWIEWWPARPDLLLVGLHPADEEEGRACYTVPAIREWNGPIIETLGTEYTSPATKAGSPDGQQVAFDDFLVPWIFTWEQGKERFDYWAYGFPELKNPGFSDPLWSPSGRYLAWFVSANSDGEEDEIMGVVQGIGVFDLVARTSKFLRPLPVWGADGGRAYLSWSPDEKHLLLSNFAWNYYRVINIDTEEILFSQDDGDGWPSRWSPDAQWIVYNEYDSETEIHSIVVASIDQTDLHVLPSFRAERWMPDSSSLLMRLRKDGKASDWPLYIFDLATRKFFLTDLPSNIEILAWVVE